MESTQTEATKQSLLGSGMFLIISEMTLSCAFLLPSVAYFFLYLLAYYGALGFVLLYTLDADDEFDPNMSWLLLRVSIPVIAFGLFYVQ